MGREVVQSLDPKGHDLHAHFTEDPTEGARLAQAVLPPKHPPTKLLTSRWLSVPLPNVPAGPHPLLLRKFTREQ